ncbi:ATP-binding protein [Parachitinimonas caeni]|uniref:histidine kinase n=1 Tax=Parachitinimonas caeni TaxID=3031301 RepID=A0ABT7DUM0_9NEIS|nr:ATP-binding protein [Parachitinimonas caeni]MDK2123674.1 ATP-binding protein [Parachitinimonas caeni]
MLPSSINGRIIVAATLILLAFLVATGAALDRAFQESAQAARHERLLGQAYLLMAAADVSPDGGILMPPQLAEPRLSLPSSGLYANVSHLAAKVEWQSNSTLGLNVPFLRGLEAGHQEFTEIADKTGKPYFVLGFGVKWATGNQNALLTFSVSEDKADYLKQIGVYRRSLWGWLGGLAGLLLLAQILLLRWGLAPMRRVAQELKEVETGNRSRLDNDYPAEIRLLTDNLNHLLAREQAQRERYRNGLADLAHSLKTPLAVLRAALSDPGHLQATVSEQVVRMDHIVQHQLQRAATAGASRLAEPIALQPIADRIAASLQKVYRDKSLTISVQVPADLTARLDSGDVFEAWGNLADNGCKWARHTVQLFAQIEAGRITLGVEDDGPGIANPAHVLKRHGRADESTPGQGIGLDVVADIAQAYDGNLQIARSRLGGALVSITVQHH